MGYEPPEIDDDMSVRVLRNGMESVIPSAQLTVGDMVHLQDGDIIPADCTLIFGDDILVDET